MRWDGVGPTICHHCCVATTACNIGRCDPSKSISARRPPHPSPSSTVLSSDLCEQQPPCFLGVDTFAGCLAILYRLNGPEIALGVMTYNLLSQSGNMVSSWANGRSIREVLQSLVSLIYMLWPFDFMSSLQGQVDLLSRPLGVRDREWCLSIEPSCDTVFMRLDCRYDRADNDLKWRILFPVSMRYAMLCIM
jgi:hypothetical protein